MKFILIGFMAGTLGWSAQDQAAEKKQAPEATAAKPDAAKEDSAADATAKSGDSAWSGSIDFGYRFRTGVGGNFNAYRSVVNLGEGPKVFGFDLHYTNAAGRLCNKFTLTGSGWGGDPYSTARLTASKERVYDFRADYRNIAYFNYLPTFANTFLDRGALIPERAYDLRRRMFDTELRLRPGSRIVPYLSYSREGGDGRGITTFVSGANEYPVSNTILDHTDRVRGGVSFEANRFRATIEEGGTWFKDDQDVSTSQRNAGDRLTPIFGQQQSLAFLNEAYRIRGDSYFTKGLLSYTPYSWIDLTGQFQYSRPHTDVNYFETSTGNFFDLNAARFFTAQTDTGTALANQPHSSGSFGVELRPLARLRIIESYSADRLSVASSVLLADLTSVSPQALSAGASDRYVMNYNREQIEGLFDLTRWFTVRGGYRRVWGDAQFRGTQVSGFTSEQGLIEQNVLLAGAQFRGGQNLRISLDAEGGAAAHSYFRTSLHDYQKGTARVRYQLTGSFGLNGSFTALNNENPTPGVNYEFDTRALATGFFWNPASGKRITVTGEYVYSTLSSNIGYLIPQELSADVSRYREHAHTGTMLAEGVTPFGGKHALHFSAGGSFFTSGGSRPSTYVQPTARLTMPVAEHAQLFAEWRNYSFGEQRYVFEGFRAHVFSVGVRVAK